MDRIEILLPRMHEWILLWHIDGCILSPS